MNIENVVTITQPWSILHVIFLMIPSLLMTQAFNQYLPNDLILLSRTLSYHPNAQINQSIPSFSLPCHNNYTVIRSDSTLFSAMFSLWTFLTSKPSSRVVPAYPQLFCKSTHISTCFYAWRPKNNCVYNNAHFLEHFHNNK